MDGGYPLKQVVVDELTRLGREVIDCGAHRYVCHETYSAAQRG
jgi:ribose 5-phosphate isomerase RpiB